MHVLDFLCADQKGVIGLSVVWRGLWRGFAAEEEEE